MATVLTGQGEMTVAATHGLWLSADDAERATGWTLKPEGMCRDDLCVPLPVRDGRIDVAAFWRLLGRPVVSDAGGETWVLGAGAAQRNDGVRRTRSRRTSRCPTSPACRTRCRRCGGKRCSSVPGPPGEAVALTCPCGSNCSTA